MASSPHAQLSSIRCKHDVRWQCVSWIKDRLSCIRKNFILPSEKWSKPGTSIAICNLWRPIEKELSSVFQQPDVDANGDAAPDVHPNAEALALADGGGQYDAAAIVGPIGPELFEAAPFPGQRGFSIQVSLQSDKVKTIF